MWAGRTSPKSGPGVGINARRHERHATDIVKCPLGDVVNVSASGIQLRCQGKPPLQPGGTARITLIFGDQQMSLVAQARWVRRRGLLRGGMRGQYEIGLRFLQLTVAKQKALESIGKYGFVAKEAPIRESRRPQPPPPPPPSVRLTIDLPDHYAALELKPGATEDAIRTAFRRLARQYHPDTTSDPDGEEKFQEVRAAYAILGDVARRRSYDRMWAS